MERNNEAAQFILHKNTVFPSYSSPQLQLSLPASVPAIAPIQEAPLVVPAPIAQPQVEEMIQITTEKDTAPEIAPEQHLVNKLIGYAPPSEMNFGTLIKPNKVAK